jgi:hypothetical protein
MLEADYFLLARAILFVANIVHLVGLMKAAMFKNPSHYLIVAKVLVTCALLITSCVILAFYAKIWLSLIWHFLVGLQALLLTKLLEKNYIRFK